MRMGYPYVNPLPEVQFLGKQHIGYASHDEVDSLRQIDMTKEV